MPQDSPKSDKFDTPRPPRGHLLACHLRFLLVVLGMLALSRVGLMLWQSARLHDPAYVVRIMLGGLRMDLILISYALIPAVLVSLVLGGPGGLGRWTASAMRVYFTVWTSVIFLLEIATPPFILEFDSRPNRLFIEYLVHPREVSAMLTTGYKLELFVATSLTALVTWMAWRTYRQRPAAAAGVGRRLLTFLIVGPALFLAARSSVQHRPANPSSVVFSDDHLLNDFALSSAYSVIYAVYRMKDEADASAVYGALESDQAVIDEVRAAMLTVPREAFTSDEIPTLHHQTASVQRDRQPNLVILLQESLGASYVGALGGEPVTLFIDTLRDEGWWFEQMYATGTRSVRGIEAVVSGFLPTPARSVVKLGRSQQGFFTLADYLGRRGYKTQFIYGGESHFDNMKGFFSGNGFSEMIDENDYDNPSFHGSWGVSDEDIMRKAHETFLQAGDTPFFSLVFSVSNHSPWEYPEGSIEPYDSPAATPRNAARYADHSLGLFFDLARGSSYWDNTIFLVVSDHCSRVFGASLVPIEHFHVPAVILGPGIEPRRDARIASQIDLGPTLLSLMGISGEHPMVGHDLTRLPADASGRALMQYGQNNAYLEDGRAVVLQPDLPPSQYNWDGHRLSASDVEPARLRRAMAYALLPSRLYRDQLYRLPDEPILAERKAADLGTHPKTAPR